MARRRGPLLLIISLLLAVFAAWVANAWLASRTVAKTTFVQEPVVTAAIDIPVGTKLDQRHLSMIYLVPGTSPKGSFHRVEDVAGKVSNTSLVAGEVLLAGRLVDAGEGSALAMMVDKNMRAVTVRVDDVVGVAGFLLPGNHVDVLAAKVEPASNVVHSTTILSNVKVLAVDQTAAADSNQPVVVHAVTLEVTPSDAELLLKNKTGGTIQLTLRNPLDQSDARAKQPEPEPVKVAAVKVAAAPRVAAPMITVIRGTDVGHTSEQGVDQPPPKE